MNVISTIHNHNLHSLPSKNNNYLKMCYAVIVSINLLKLYDTITNISIILIQKKTNLVIRNLILVIFLTHVVSG